VRRLSQRLELVHGPPGTGKSTTICAIVQSAVPRGELVVVTSTRNRAVSVIAKKLLSSGSRYDSQFDVNASHLCRVVTFGNPNRLTDSAARLLFDRQLCQHQDLVMWSMFTQKLTQYLVAIEVCLLLVPCLSVTLSGHSGQVHVSAH
jgi:predicted ATP-dependent serine protease